MSDEPSANLKSQIEAEVSLQLGKRIDSYRWTIGSFIAGFAFFGFTAYLTSFQSFIDVHVDHRINERLPADDNGKAFRFFVGPTYTEGSFKKPDTYDADFVQVEWKFKELKLDSDPKIFVSMQTNSIALPFSLHDVNLEHAFVRIQKKDIESLGKENRFTVRLFAVGR